MWPLASVLAFAALLAVTAAVLICRGVRGVQVTVRWAGESAAERKAAAAKEGT
jgi:hypothetical protein